MKKAIQTTDIRGKLVVLGSGTSVGVPAIGCPCDVCQSANPKNQRSRCSVVVGLPEGNLLIDTSPDLRSQLLREKIGIVHSVLYTHEHADHIMGLDDLRLMQFYLGAPVPIYCEEVVEARIRKSFDYAFDGVEQTHAGAVPKLEFCRIGLDPFRVLGAEITPVRLQHGPRFEVLGFRIGNIAYCTDTNRIPEESQALLRDLDVLIIDGLRHTPHVSHFSIEEAMKISVSLGTKQTYFTHICHDLEHEVTNERLPKNFELAYDGLQIELT